MSKPYKVDIKSNDSGEKRMTAVFYDKEGKKIKTVHFGQRVPTGKGAYPDHKDDDIKKAWVARHEVRGTFNDPMTASALSRWILWGEKTISASIKAYKNKFDLK